MVSLVSFYKSLNIERDWFYNAGFGDMDNCKVSDIAGIAHNLHFQKHYETVIKLFEYCFEYARTREYIAQFHIVFAENYEKLIE